MSKQLRFYIWHILAAAIASVITLCMLKYMTEVKTNKLLAVAFSAYVAIFVLRSAFSSFVRFGEPTSKQFLQNNYFMVFEIISLLLVGGMLFRGTSLTSEPEIEFRLVNLEPSVIITIILCITILTLNSGSSHKKLGDK